MPPGWPRGRATRGASPPQDRSSSATGPAGRPWSGRFGASSSVCRGDSAGGSRRARRRDPRPGPRHTHRRSRPGCRPRYRRLGALQPRDRRPRAPAAGFGGSAAWPMSIANTNSGPAPSPARCSTPWPGRRTMTAIGSSCSPRTGNLLRPLRPRHRPPAVSSPPTRPRVRRGRRRRRPASPSGPIPPGPRPGSVLAGGNLVNRYRSQHDTAGRLRLPVWCPRGRGVHHHPDLRPGHRAGHDADTTSARVDRAGSTARPRLPPSTSGARHTWPLGHRPHRHGRRPRPTLARRGSRPAAPLASDQIMAAADVDATIGTAMRPTSPWTRGPSSCAPSRARHGRFTPPAGDHNQPRPRGQN